MKTLFIGQNSIHLSSIDSTNSYASELLHQMKLSEGSLIYTFDQKKGRGQRGNSWESEPNKNAALSIVLYPSFLQADEQYLLTKITSLAVADLMSELLKISDKAKEVKIKWPNDIYVNSRKIAGILTENTLRGNGIQSTIIGIGININQTNFVVENATSVKLLFKEVDLIFCIKRLCKLLEAYYLQLKAGKHESIHIAYLNYLYQLNEWREYKANNNSFRGKITGVSKAGKLQVQLETLEIKDFSLKEIQFVIS